MFEKYFAQYQEREKINPTFTQPMNEEPQKRISKYLAFDKEKLLTDIAERISFEDTKVPTEHLLDVKIMQAIIVDKGYIRFHIQLDPMLSSAIKPLCHILGNFYCIKKEKALRYDLSPYVSYVSYVENQPFQPPRVDMFSSQVHHPNMGMYGNNQLWVFDVTKLDMVN